MARNVQFIMGLFSFPARLEGAVAKGPEMSNLCPGQPGKDPHDPLPVKMPKVCTACGPITDITVLKKGIKHGTAYTVVDADQVALARESYASEFKGSLQFVPHPAADVLSTTGPGDSLNYLTPADVTGEAHYQLMLRLVKEHPEVAFLALYTPTSATSLFMLSARGDALVVEKRVRSQSLKPAPSVGGTVNEQLYGVLSASLPMLTAPYDPDAYEDRYAEAIRALDEAGEKVSVDTAPTAPTVTVSDDDIMTKLVALQQAQKPKPARKRAAKKSAAKKPAAKAEAA